MTKRKVSKARRARKPDRPLRLEYVEAGTLTDNPRNWRRHPEAQAGALRAVLEDPEIGWAGALLYNERTGRLIDGHARKGMVDPKAAVPVLIGSWSEPAERKILATLDPLAGLATVDAEQLQGLLKDVDLSGDAFAGLLEGLQGEVAKASKTEVAEDEVPEPPKKAITKPGDLWLLGGHRVLCGDATDAAIVGRLMGNVQAVLMATDPPYGVDFWGAKYNPKAKDWPGIEGDKRQGEDLTRWLSEVLTAWLPVMVDEAAFYLWTAPMQEGAAAAAALLRVGLHIQSQIIWVKNVLVLGQADYQWKHETCWYAYRKGHKHRWLAGRDQTTTWEVAKVANARYEHPHQKPVELYARSMRNHTRQGEVCVDPFLGSGTSLIAAEQLGRKCYGLEIEPRYCDVIVERWQNLTGKKAKRKR